MVCVGGSGVNRWDSYRRFCAGAQNSCCGRSARRRCQVKDEVGGAGTNDRVCLSPRALDGWPARTQHQVNKAQRGDLGKEQVG